MKKEVSINNDNSKSPKDKTNQYELEKAYKILLENRHKKIQLWKQ